VHTTWVVPQLMWFVTSLLLWRPGFTFWDRSVKMEGIWTSSVCLVLASHNTALSENSLSTWWYWRII